MKKLHARICAALMTSSVMLGMIHSVQVFAATNDIDGHWAQMQIQNFADQGYISGDGTGNYFPNQVMVRAQFAAIVNRIMKFTEESAAIASFTDVPESAWYRSDLAKALSAGYMRGTSAITMSPDTPVTREQASAMLVRLLQLETAPNTAVLDIFTDKDDIADYAVENMAKLVESGYLFGAEGKLMPKKALTRAEGISLLSRSMGTIKNNNENEEKKESEEKTISVQDTQNDKKGRRSYRGGSHGSGSHENSSSKPAANIAKTAQTKLIDLGRSQYVVVSFEDGFSKENTKLIVDGVDVTSDFTKVDDDGTIVKWELTSLNPGRIVLESGGNRQEVKLTDNPNPAKPKVLPELPESYNIIANGAVSVWDYHLTNYDKAGNERIYPKKTTFDLDTKDETIPYYSPDAEVSAEGTGEVILMFRYTTEEEKQWFDSISDVDLVAYNENNNTLNNELKYTAKPADHHGKTVGQITIPLGQRNFFSNGRYKIRVTSGEESQLFSVHVVNEKAPSMHLQGNGGILQSGENVHFHVEDMVYGVTMPVYRVTLTTPKGETKELERITDWYLIGDLFVLYNDGEGHNNTPDLGEYTITVYADGFKPMETSFAVGGNIRPAARRINDTVDAVTMATFSGGGSSGDGGGSSKMNAYLIFDSDLLANAEIITQLGIQQESAAKITERWNQDMTSWLYVFDKSGKIFYDYSGKNGAFTNMVKEAAKNGKYLTFTEYQNSGYASITQNHPYAAKYVLEDNLLGQTQMGGSYIGRPAPDLKAAESVEGKDLKFYCADMDYLEAIAENGKIYINQDLLHPLQNDDFAVNRQEKNLTISKEHVQIGENIIRIAVSGYQDQELHVNYGKTLEEVTLEAAAGTAGESVTVKVSGEQATGDIWKYLKEVKLTYPDGKEKSVLPDGHETVSEKIGYQVAGKNLILGKDLFTQIGDYQLSVAAEYYGTKTVKFTVGDQESGKLKPIPNYSKVTCEKGNLAETTYTFAFAPAYQNEINEWIKAVNKVTVNGTEFDSSAAADLRFTTYATDQQLKLHGDKPFVEGNNEIVISAKGYEDLTLTVGKDGTVGEGSGKEPEPEQDKKAPKVNTFTFVDEPFGDDYYRLHFQLDETESSAYLNAITSIKINNQPCRKVSLRFWNDKNAYKFSNDTVYGGAIQFIDFTADCFQEKETVYHVEITANGYETQNIQVKNGSLTDGESPAEPDTGINTPTVKALVFKNELLIRSYRLSFNEAEKEVAAYLRAITDIEADGKNCKEVTGLWNETAAYKFSNDESYGGEKQFIDFSEDCFKGKDDITVKIYADGYQTLEYVYHADGTNH